jgi:hypothetical protein
VHAEELPVFGPPRPEQGAQRHRSLIDLCRGRALLLADTALDLDLGVERRFEMGGSLVELPDLLLFLALALPARGEPRADHQQRRGRDEDDRLGAAAQDEDDTHQDRYGES